MKNFIKKLLKSIVSHSTEFTEHSTHTTHVHISDKGTTIEVDGKKVDPKSKEGKKILTRMNKKIHIVDTAMTGVENAMDGVAEALRDIAKNL